MDDVGDNLSPNEEITLDAVKSRAVKGVVVLTGRAFFLSIVSLLATGFLTVFLEPAEFGVFWIVSAIVNFLSYFADIGLAAALIQRKEPTTDEDLKTTFTLQQILVLTIFLIIVIGMPIFSKTYSLSTDGRNLLYALAISMILASLKTIPSVLLERNLEFSKLVIPQIIESLVYSLTVVFLAWKGFGISSFSIAVLIRGSLGLTLIYILKPWKPGLAFSKKSLKKLLSFGVPYQVNSLLATLKDDGMTAVLGGILGATGVGYLGWAQKWGYSPLRFFMDHVIKVTFPAFSRMQDDKKQLSSSVEKSIFFICFLVFPFLIGLLTVSPLLVKLIPRYGKWEPALLALYLIGINTVFASVSTQLTNLFNSIGKIKITFKLMIMWTGLSWLLIPFLSIKYGFNGAALGYSLVGLSSVVAIYVAKKYVSFSLSKSVLKPALSTLFMAIIVIFLKRFLPVSYISVAILIFVGIVSYSISSYLIIGSSIVKDVKRSYKTLFSK